MSHHISGDTRAQNLKANLPRAEAHEIDQALARLTGIGRTGMGTLFKVMALMHRDLPAPPGFEHRHTAAVDPAFITPIDGNVLINCPIQTLRSVWFPAKNLW